MDCPIEHNVVVIGCCVVCECCVLSVERTMILEEEKAILLFSKLLVAYLLAVFISNSTK